MPSMAATATSEGTTPSTGKHRAVHSTLETRRVAILSDQNAPTPSMPMLNANITAQAAVDAIAASVLDVDSTARAL